jgi:hypothetical protein
MAVLDENSNGPAGLNLAFDHRTAPAEWSSQGSKITISQAGEALRTELIEYLDDCIELPPLTLIRTPPFVRNTYGTTTWAAGTQRPDQPNGVPLGVGLAR